VSNNGPANPAKAAILIANIYNKLTIEANAGLSVIDEIKCDNTGIYNKN